MDPRRCIRNGFANGSHKVWWSLNRLYMAIKEGVNKDLLP